MTSKEYETELENENESNGRKARDLEETCERLTKELEKVQAKYNSEVRAVEKEIDALRKSLTNTGDNAKIN